MNFKKSVRELIFKKYNGKCAYCGIDLDNNNLNNINYMQIDHMIPKKDYIDNYNPSCKSCNSQKKNKTVDEYRLYLTKKQFNIPNFTLEQLNWINKKSENFINIYNDYINKNIIKFHCDNKDINYVK